MTTPTTPTNKKLVYVTLAIPLIGASIALSFGDPACLSNQTDTDSTTVSDTSLTDSVSTSTSTSVDSRSTSDTDVSIDVTLTSDSGL